MIKIVVLAVLTALALSQLSTSCNPTTANFVPYNFDIGCTPGSLSCSSNTTVPFFVNLTKPISGYSTYMNVSSTNAPASSTMCLSFTYNWVKY